MGWINQDQQHYTGLLVLVTQVRVCERESVVCVCVCVIFIVLDSTVWHSAMCEMYLLVSDCVKLLLEVGNTQINVQV